MSGETGESGRGMKPTLTNPNTVRLVCFRLWYRSGVWWFLTVSDRGAQVQVCGGDFLPHTLCRAAGREETRSERSEAERKTLPRRRAMQHVHTPTRCANAL